MPRGDRGGKCLVSGERCVAANCGNTRANGVSMYRFRTVKETYRYQMWTDFVRIKRKDWTPTKHSILCSAHFEEKWLSFRHFFEIDNMAPRKRKYCKLHEDAVPTIHAKSPVEPPADHRKRPGEKDQKCLLLDDTPSEQSARKVEYDYLPRETSPKKTKRAHAKKGASRDDIPLTEKSCNVGCQVNVKTKMISKGCQTSLDRKRNYHSKKIQKGRAADKGCQTDATVFEKPTLKGEFVQADVRWKSFDNRNNSTAYLVESPLSPITHWEPSSSTIASEEDSFSPIVTKKPEKHPLSSIAYQGPPFSIKERDNFPFSVEEHEERSSSPIVKEEFKDAPSSPEAQEEPPFSHKEQDNIPFSPETQEERSLSPIVKEEFEDAPSSPETQEERSFSHREQDNLPFSPEAQEERSLSPIVKEEFEDALSSPEAQEEPTFSHKEQDNLSFSPEAQEERSLSPIVKKEFEDAPPSHLVQEESSFSPTKQKEPLLLTIAKEEPDDLP